MRQVSPSEATLGRLLRFVVTPLVMWSVLATTVHAQPDATPVEAVEPALGTDQDDGGADRFESAGSRAGVLGG